LSTLLIPNLSIELRQEGVAENAANDSQPAPNISTEHQKEGDARSPGDTFDRGQ